MATETLRPDATGSENANNPYPTAPENNPAYNWLRVDEADSDGDDTFIYNGSVTYLRDLYNMEAHSVGSGVINSITIYMNIRVRDAGYTAYGKVSQQSGETITDGTEQSTTSTTYGLKSQTYTINPATGFAYTWDEIDALEIGAYLKVNDINSRVRCTQVYAEVDFTEAGTLITAAMRRMAASFKPFLKAPIPDGTIDVKDRTHIAWNYGGLATSITVGQPYSSRVQGVQGMRTWGGI